MGGELIAEHEGVTATPTTPTKEYVYGPTGMLAEVTGSEVNYLTPDHLGSPRVLTSQNGIVVNRRDFFPFGEDIAVGVGGRSAGMGYGTDSLRQKFSGKERDQETGLDFFGARYYANSMGRFTAADPLLSSGHPLVPQSWNRYSYTTNNPLNLTDPTGMFTIDPNLTPDQQDKIKKAYDDLKTAQGKYQNGSKDYNRIQKALDYLGKPGEKNGVFVTVAAVGKGPQKELARAEHKGLGGPKTGLNKTGLKVTISFNETEFKQASSTAIAASLGHEAIHAADYIGLANQGKTNLNKSWTNTIRRNSENEGWNVTAAVHQALEPDKALAVPARFYVPGGLNLLSPFPQLLWDPAWAKVDEKTIETRRGITIENLLTTQENDGGYGLTRPPK